MLRNVKVFSDTKMVLEIIDRLIELDNEMFRKEVNNMVKIKVSYEHDYELHKLKTKLDSVVKSIRVPRVQKGRYKKAYIELKDIVR